MGITALMLLLVQAAWSTAVGIVVGGPLMGGLWLYLLKRVRGEPTGLETGFSGFRIAFLNLFLAGFVTLLLTVLGFFCLVLPGLYLADAWMFTLIVIIDQRLDFWPAMELSRKIVTRHWWKFFAFWLVLLLMNFAGLLVCGLGIFVTAPVTLAATVFAYEDIFGPARRKALEPSPRVGPSGTAVLPGATNAPYLGGGAWKPIIISLAAILFLLVVIAAISRDRARRMAEGAAWYAQQMAAQAEEALPNFVLAR